LHHPQLRVVRINVDGSCINSSRTGGFLLSDWTGKVIKVGAANYGHTSILVAKAQALKDGVYLAVQASYKEISTEGDNPVVIQALKGINQVPWQIATIIKDVCIWINQGLQVTINHTFRLANMAAKWLSKFVHSITNVFTAKSVSYYFLVKSYWMISLDVLL